MNKTIQTKAGTLTILDEWRVENSQKRCSIICFCGKKFETFLHHLKSGNSQSCGCVRIKILYRRLFKHGHSAKHISTTTYKSWEGCKGKVKINKNYIKKGIKLCKEWELFENFLNDMGEKPLGHIFSRIDKSRDFEPDNCEWVPIKTRIKK